MAMWMHACVFAYRKREYYYFVDGHERPETIAYRPLAFCQNLHGGQETSSLLAPNDIDHRITRITNQMGALILNAVDTICC